MCRPVHRNLYFDQTFAAMFFLFWSDRTGPIPRFPTKDTELFAERPCQGTPRGQDHVDRLADAAGRDPGNGPSSARDPGDNGSASDPERIMAVLHTGRSISSKRDAAAVRHGMGGRVRERPSLRKKRVRCVPFLSRRVARGVSRSDSPPQTITAQLRSPLCGGLL